MENCLNIFKAVNDFCSIFCMGGEAQLIRGCASLSCPLHGYRMGLEKVNDVTPVDADADRVANVTPAVWGVKYKTKMDN